VAEEKNGCGLSGAAVSKREVGVSGSTTGGLRCMTRATKVGVIEERWVVWSTKDGCGRRDMDVVKEKRLWSKRNLRLLHSLHSALVLGLIIEQLNA
jgi:hypothetical protein